jgi:hypothetical protein
MFDFDRGAVLWHDMYVPCSLLIQRYSTTIFAEALAQYSLQSTILLCVRAAMLTQPFHDVARVETPESALRAPSESRPLENVASKMDMASITCLLRLNSCRSTGIRRMYPDAAQSTGDLDRLHIRVVTCRLSMNSKGS